MATVNLSISKFCTRAGANVVRYEAIQNSRTRRLSTLTPRLSRPKPTHRLVHPQKLLARPITIDSVLTSSNPADDPGPPSQEHALISTFDLFSIGIGPSSSHTVGPMRAGNIFIADLWEKSLLHRVSRLRVTLYGSLALTGEGHMTPSALLLGLEGADVATVDTSYIPVRFSEIQTTKKLRLGWTSDHQEIDFDYARDFVWERARKLPLHSNGMRLSVFDENGDPIAMNDLFSIGGGFVVNGGMEVGPDSGKTEARPLDLANESREASTGDNVGEMNLPDNPFYKEGRRDSSNSGTTIESTSEKAKSGLSVLSEAISGANVEKARDEVRKSDDQIQQVPYHFHNAESLLALCKKHNLTIAQLMYENEKGLGYTDDQIFDKLFGLWEVMDQCIQEGVTAPLNSTLPGSLKLKRRAPGLYQRLTKGLYSDPTGPESIGAPAVQQYQPQISSPETNSSENALQTDTHTPKRLNVKRRPPHWTPRLHGSPTHPISLIPIRSTNFPAMDHLTTYAIAVNETNAAGGRVVTAPTNGAAGIIPAVLKYVVEFVSDDPERDVPIFLLTAAAIASLYKRGATISAAEGGCMAEVGVACSMAAGAYAACMGAGPATIEQAAEIGIEHNLGLTCDPINGLVQAPCIERNALGAVKAISSANLALNSLVGTQKVRLDDAIRAMRLTAKGMRDEFKETSLSGLATSVPIDIPVSVPDC